MYKETKKNDALKDAMSLQDLQLPATVIQNLFRNSLVDLKDEMQKVPVSQKQHLHFLGNNSKQIILLVNHPGEVNLSDSQLNFLISILSACKLTLDDIALLNLAKHSDIDYLEIATSLKASIIIMHEVAPALLRLPFNIPQFQVQQFNDQTYLLVPSLAVLAMDKEQKRKFWTSLKQIFAL